MEYLILIFYADSEPTTTFESNSDSSQLNSESPEPSERQNFRGTKIARRARSFKDDFLGKIYQMKTPTSTISRYNVDSPSMINFLTDAFSIPRADRIHRKRKILRLCTETRVPNRRMI